MNPASIREWLAHWGDGPNWSDETGVTVPIVKTTLAELLDVAEKSREALRDIRSRLLDRAPGSSGSLDTMTRANLAAIADDALSGSD